LSSADKVPDEPARTALMDRGGIYAELFNLQAEG